MTVTLGIHKLDTVPTRQVASEKARALLSAMLRDSGIEAPIPLPIETGENGRPYLTLENASVDFNLSHAGHYVACVLAVADRDDETPRVGVDVEIPHERTDPERLARRFFAPAEIRFLEENGFSGESFLRVWTAKEAYMKFTGMGLSGGMQKTDTTAPESLSPVAVIARYPLDTELAICSVAAPPSATLPQKPTLYETL